MSSSSTSKRILSQDDFGLNIARGLVPTISTLFKFGNISNITVAPSDVWSLGGVYTGQPLAAVTPETAAVLSNSASDAAAGVGARTVRVTGLDSSWNEVSEDVTLNGVTPVNTVGTWRRIYRAYVLTAGSSETNVGTLTIRYTTTTSIVFAGILPGVAQTTVSAYTVPLGKVLLINKIQTTLSRASGAAGSAVCSLRIRESGGVFRSRRYFNLTTSYALNEESMGISVPALSDIKVRVDSYSDASSNVFATYEGYLYNA